jgi:ribosomal protein S27E
MTKTVLGTDNAKPCWSCGSTIAAYTLDSEISLIGVRCASCHRTDVFYAQGSPTTAAEVSSEHRSTN